MATVKSTPLNCIVDDSALVASVRKGAPHGIRPWLAQDAINVFVPVSALDRLTALRDINCPVRGDAQKALKWLDDITSLTASKEFGRVELQGPDNQYDSWQEVERYLLPDTPLSRSNGQGQDRVDALSKILDRNLNMDSSPSSSTQTQGTKRSPSASPTSSASSLSSAGADGNTKPDESSTVLSAHGIPPTVRPLLNFVVWRTHHQEDMSAEPEKYILVTNDPIIQKQASKFGVRAKLLSQLTTILAKEGIKPVAPSQLLSAETNGRKNDEEDPSDDEDRVVFDPSKRPGSSRGLPPPANKSPDQSANVIDPDHFGRNDKIPSAKPATPTGPATNLPHRGGRGAFNSNRGYPSNYRQHQHSNSQQGAQRGRGGNYVSARGMKNPGRANGHVQSLPRGSTQYVPARGSSNGLATAPRGNAAFRGRGGSLPFAPRGGAPHTTRSQFVQKPIDPDSFARPSPFGRGRGRGAATHRLWEPTGSG